MCLLGAGALFLYADPLIAMVRQWDASPMYSYAFAVPPVALFLLWTRREDLQRQPVRPARFVGGAVLVLALVMLVAGRAASVQIVQQFSFLIAIVGVGLILFGPGHLRLAAPALAYLTFMIPFWDVFTEPLHRPFQDKSAAVGVAMLQTVGIPVHREGTIISLSNMTLEVARQCSGVNYLIAVLAIALPLCYVRLRGWWRRVLLIGSAMVVAALANGVRVALIGALAYWDIGSPLHGPFHVLHGLFVAGIGYVVLFAGLHVVEKGQTPAHPLAANSSAERHNPATWSVRIAGGLAVAFWTLAIASAMPLSVRAALAIPLDRLPAQLGNWTMDLTEIEGGELATGWSVADSQIHRRYRQANGTLASVQIWYFESQAQSHELVNSESAHLHRSAVVRAFPVANGQTLTANVVRLPGEIGLFWYELDGGPEFSHYSAKMKSLWSTLVSRRSNGAAVMLRTTRSPEEADDAIIEPLENLAAEVHGALARHWSSAAFDHGAR